jgi:hypothetical protein
MRPSYFQVEQAKRMLPITLILTKQQGYPANIFVQYPAAGRKEIERAKFEKSVAFTYPNDPDLSSAFPRFILIK